MFPMIVSLSTAIMFAIASIATYGFSNVISAPWMVNTFVFLILMGVMLGFLGNSHSDHDQHVFG